MKRHRWSKARFHVRGPGWKCLDCGLRRRIKPGTRSIWQFRFYAGEPWVRQLPCGPQRPLAAL